MKLSHLIPHNNQMKWAFLFLYIRNEKVEAWNSAKVIWIVQTNARIWLQVVCLLSQETWTLH